ncbi:phage tail family protein [Arthrobacter sp. zg-Y859]|uniref:Phage tail family protein n=1 Tax=Arthrobacter jinronghuae TaxID=2964609 RepID=A0ABT1NV58_9MICC|nr:phage tail family protein [Arthrobacter jinronghuae]MCQ1951623.1 phage tail family protein [Arthrobacter jinronghuae]UWX79663.1 phage tail family protein [Arthrobacter jinronghuae]
MQLIYAFAPPLPLQPFSRFALTMNGLPLTGRDEDGVLWSVKKPFVGWSARTGTTGTATQRWQQHGAWLGEAHSTGRTLVISGDLRVRPGNGAEGQAQHLKLVAALDQLMGLIPDRDTAPLVVDEDGLRRHVRARLDGDPSDPVWVNPWMVRYSFQLFAPDYRRLAGDGSGPTHSATTALPSTSGGLVFPAAVPFVVDAVVVSGEIPVLNSGTAPAPVVASIKGPVPRPSIQRRETGEVMTFDLDVLAGQTLAVDFDRRTVNLNGVSRRGSLRGRWFELGPGLNTLKFDAAAYSPTATMTASWYDAWK